ncbi:hypothetical protein [Jeotgalibacillus proteolyticus]|uniref:Short-chain dehydrogenase n=1 Tax=Jeotgalibacillus proteolyticus TaxID=2082395 RepID=A0A2S5GGV6_9BACL|nr:hypothetical protein [Jeotgalibacillus proteolyticus]PPA72219.1 hypothetical protein C4B60_02250 [Jeotgalibacillus proteolyticus]
MTAFYAGLIIILIMTGIAGIALTLRIANLKSNTEDGRDESVSGAVRRHSIVLNPIFLTYVIAGILIMGYVVYLIMIT